MYPYINTCRVNSNIQIFALKLYLVPVANIRWRFPSPWLKPTSENFIVILQRENAFKFCFVRGAGWPLVPRHNCNLFSCASWLRRGIPSKRTFTTLIRKLSFRNMLVSFLLRAISILFSPLCSLRLGGDRDGQTIVARDANDHSIMTTS